MIIAATDTTNSEYIFILLCTVKPIITTYTHYSICSFSLSLSLSLNYNYFWAKWIVPFLYMLKKVGFKIRILLFFKKYFERKHSVQKLQRKRCSTWNYFWHCRISRKCINYETLHLEVFNETFYEITFDFFTKLHLTLSVSLENIRKRFPMEPSKKDDLKIKNSDKHF